MKREKDRFGVFGIKEISPLLFWKTCEVCDIEFRRESGWVFRRVWHGQSTIRTYLCQDCATTEEDVQHHLVKTGYPSLGKYLKGRYDEEGVREYLSGDIGRPNVYSSLDKYLSRGD